MLDLFTDEDLENYLLQNPTNETVSVGDDINPNNIQQFTYGKNPSGIHEFTMIKFYSIKFIGISVKLY